MGWIKVLVLAMLATASGLAEAAEERRVALIVGNDAYKALKPLDNAVNDARAIERELKALGWETTLKTNAGRRDLHAAIDAFGGKLSSGAVGLFYYAGHGIEARGQNFLVPVDATVETESDLRSDAVEAAEVIATMKAADNPMNIVILDACRDNPLKARSGSRGLAVIPVAGGSAGMFVAYAAAPGEKADDGAKGGNGVFTAELVKALQVPGLTIEQVFKRSVAGVKSRTGGRQVPWTQASLSGDFYFRPGAAKAEVPVTSGGGGDKEALFWSTIKDSKDGADFDAYLKRYPNGDFADLARNRLEALKGAKTPRKEAAVQQVAAIVPQPPEARSAPAIPVVAVVPLQPELRSAPVIPDASGSVFRDCTDCPEMVVVPAGSFLMGSDAAEQDWHSAQNGEWGNPSSESPQHRVTIGRAFAVGKYEVTQAEWQSLMGIVPSKFPGLRNPVEYVSWNDTQEFIRRLNAKVRGVLSVSTGGDGPYRLLTEAEWEYAARAGTTTKFSWGDSVGSGNAVCKGCGSSWDSKQPAPVGSFRANAFGLYDVHGNVFEWVQDCFVGSYAGAPADGSPIAGDSACYRIVRGGSWDQGPAHSRSAVRNRGGAAVRISRVGFRLARTLP